jgi:hypothetical protein
MAVALFSARKETSTLHIVIAGLVPAISLR